MQNTPGFHLEFSVPPVHLRLVRRRRHAAAALPTFRASREREAPSPSDALNSSPSTPLLHSLLPQQLRLNAPPPPAPRHSGPPHTRRRRLRHHPPPGSATSIPLWSAITSFERVRLIRVYDMKVQMTLLITFHFRKYDSW
uniref:Uncharacterized protein n=1 Tax=Setaria viridis TaxID=4556 RepID=A0A4U6W6H7_SETVI|nr:hypothetical protein SEVIR_1G099400v2 [Setaria viridis]TKW38219.1 hypothetical protein SEVIR_1G099400v2 [Setaria viridis]TKW38220.1 hypothetical protein SEVIR_1G099400v2 [Setaria viridis]